MQKIPQGFSTITPYIHVKDADKAMEIYVKAFGAKEVHRMNCPQTGKVAHACLEIGSSKIFISDLFPERGCSSSTNCSFYLYMDDVDAACRKAKDAGLDEVSAPQDQFWGDRTGSFKDNFGNSWTLATHVRDVSPEEMAEATKKMANKAA